MPSDSDAAKPTRAVRSTRFTASYKEPSDRVEAVILIDSDTPTAGKKVTKKRAAASPAPKSPRQRRRRHSLVQYHESASDDSSVSSESDGGKDEESSEDEDEEPMKIQRILACRTETRAAWKALIAETMPNTSEIEEGSRWFQTDQDADDQVHEERFLVKWVNLSYLHVSWETQHDLIDQVENAKTYLSTFFRKSAANVEYTGDAAPLSSTRCFYSADDRCDGDYFDPAYTQVDRVLQLAEVDDDSETATNKKDREVLVKWKNLPYSDATYEYERDLIACDVDNYPEELHLFESMRSVKPTKSQRRALIKRGELELRRTYNLFFGSDEDGETDLNDDEQNSGEATSEGKTPLSRRERAIKHYQKEIQTRVYKNGGQLRDYQAEGVTWMIANYVSDAGAGNAQSSILADEMGLGKVSRC
jgi:Chromo (CHRromatin Organisation MOdifier) domain